MTTSPRARPRRRTTWARRPGSTRTEALETLRERYARGELTHEEFERKLEALMETESPEQAERRVEREREEA